MYIFEPVSIILTLFEWEKIQNKLKLNSCCLKPLKMYAVQLFHPGKITVQRSHLKAPNDHDFHAHDECMQTSDSCSTNFRHHCGSTWLAVVLRLLLCAISSSAVVPVLTQHPVSTLSSWPYRTLCI